MTSREFDLARLGAGLAFAEALPRLRSVLGESATAVVAAAPGSGKTTLVPPAIANRVPGRVIVTQPRRVAARAAARRLTALDGSALGARVGFSVRGERQVDVDTRIEMVTPGILLRRLLGDPELTGVDAIVLDEIHERSLDTDLLLGLLGEVRELRPDLVLVAMSATLDADRYGVLLGAADAPAPIVTQQASAHPLTEIWAPSPTDRLDDRGVTSGFLRHVATITAEAHADLLRRNPHADALVFAPGAREVSRIADELHALAPGTEVLELHAQVSTRAQDRAVGGRVAGGPPRIIVATSIAESSLTVPGVSLVVDTCLSRVPRRDAARGMSGLVTVPAPRASAIQRAGRAARLGPGTVVRCVDARTYAAAPPYATPEVLTSDLTEASLLLACWGSPGGRGLRLPDPLPLEAARDAQETLASIGAVASDGRATDLGERLVRVPADPRLARALFDGAPVLGARPAAEVVALIALDTRSDDADAAETLRALRTGRHPRAREWRREAERFEKLIGTVAVPTARTAGATDGIIAALAFPGRIAHRVAASDTGAVFLLASGSRAGISGPLASAEWLAVADVSRAQGRVAAGTGAVIRSAFEIDVDTARQAAAALRTDRVEASFDGGRLITRREHRIGAIVISSTPMRPEPNEATLGAVRRALERDGLGMFSWSEAATALRNRMALLHRELGAPWPDVTDTALTVRSDDWLAPELAALASGTPVARVDLLSALRRLLPWPAASELESLAPERLRVPSGSSIRVAYPDAGDPTAQPVVAVKLQEMFGLGTTPRLVGGRVPVLFHLLSPGGKPVAVTSDLASFWAGPYAQVRAEMRARYPKHPWPDDPHSHVATAKTNHRLNER